MSHYLIVTDLGDGEFDYEVEHEPDCPRVGYETSLDHQWIEIECNIGKVISYTGFDDLKDDLKFKTPGKHEIEFFYSKGGYYGDYIEDEWYIYFV